MPLSLDVHEQFLPHGEVRLQSAVDVGRLHVPQTLVLQPHLEEKGRRESEREEREKLLYHVLPSKSATEGHAGQRNSTKKQTKRYEVPTLT